jgi:hypothetical protein
MSPTYLLCGASFYIIVDVEAYLYKKVRRNRKICYAHELLYVVVFDDGTFFG